MCMCASWCTGCLANTKGIAATSSKSVIVLGSVAGAPLPPPLLLAPPGAPAVATVACVTLSKKWDRNKFLQDAIFRQQSGWLRSRCVHHCLQVFTISNTNRIPARKHAEDSDLIEQSRTLHQNYFFFGAVSHWNTLSLASCIQLSQRVRIWLHVSHLRVTWEVGVSNVWRSGNQ